MADRFELRRDIRLSTRVTAAHFDEAACRWRRERWRPRLLGAFPDLLTNPRANEPLSADGVPLSTNTECTECVHHSQVAKYRMPISISR